VSVVSVIISGRGVVLTPTFKAHVAGKLTKLERLGWRIATARVRCRGEKFRRTVRVTISVRRRTFSSAGTAQDLGAAVDLALEALARQLRQAHDRRRSAAKRWPRPPRAAQPVA